MKISVVGTGYVGLVVGVCFAENGNTVICVDNDAAKIRALEQGRIPIYEPGLEELVTRNRREERLAFTTSLAQAAAASQIVFIAVDTPSGEDGAADLTNVLEVAREIAAALDGYTIIATKSTVPAGTAARLREVVAEATTQPFSIVTNPEFLKQGAAIDDFMRPDRVVIGADDDRAARTMRTLYAPFTRTGAPIMVMDCASAELSKYAANAMLATRVSFMNEMANVCEAFGADVDEVRRVIAADRRIGPAFLFPGVGYGGSCFPKDLRALAGLARGNGYECRILDAVEAVNEAQKSRLVARMKEYFTSLRGKTIALWGLAFKPRTDDMREAPSIAIANGVLEAGGHVVAYDPQAIETARKVMDRRVAYAANAYDALRGAHALAIVTEWNAFREPDFARMRELLRSPVIFDGRNLFAVEQMRSEGFTYFSIGR
ncbi:MAG: UDP-glucose/GDP-mannose dehydrogenase family protein [Acidobacteria bacterium]|nr:UDP-glucose/GDP-mannose dehydrogenase family protein [Acidobacteriota bacterium]